MAVSWDVKKDGDYLYILGARDSIFENIFIQQYDLKGNWIAEYPVARVGKLDQIGEITFGDGFCGISLGSEGVVLLRMDSGRLLPGYSIYNHSAEFCDLVISDGLLYASDYYGGYYIYHIDSGLPWMAGYIKTSEEGGNGICLVDNYLLAADGPSGLTVIDVKDAQNPIRANDYITTWGTDISVFGELAFLSDGQGGCVVFDISDLPNLNVLGELPRGGYWTHVYADGNYIYGIDSYSGVHIYNYISEDIHIIAKNSAVKPSGPTIHEVHPNPFNSETRISFSLPEADDIDVSIYDITGRKAVTLIKDRLPEGSYTLRWRAENASSGTYFAVLKTTTDQIEKKIILVK